MSTNTKRGSNCLGAMALLLLLALFAAPETAEAYTSVRARSTAYQQTGDPDASRTILPTRRTIVWSRGTYTRARSQSVASPYDALLAQEPDPLYAYWDKETTATAGLLQQPRALAFPNPMLLLSDANTFATDFGNARSGGRSHEGHDILAPAGIPIVSPTDAVVVAIKQGASAGNYIYTKNPAGELFGYLHLARFNQDLDVGDNISAGTILGYNGDTGNAYGTTHLHFEVRVNTHPVDPYERIDRNYTQEEKIALLRTNLDQMSDEEAAYLRAMVASYAPTTIRRALLPTISDRQDARYAVLQSSLTPIESGNHDPLVGVLQAWLIREATGSQAYALKEIGATGYHGSLTAAALREWQRSVGLEATGEINQETVNWFRGIAPVAPTTRRVLLRR